YIDSVSNPFYVPNTQLKSKRFEQVVTSLMIQNDSTTLPQQSSSVVPATSVSIPTTT
ncbi:unnamed protein product, partial [Rotaria sordida]